MLTNSLYYPSIQVQNDAWLRKAILYWDSINPIAPKIVSDQLPENSISKILEKKGFLNFVHPEQLLDGRLGGQLSDNFTELINSDPVQRILPRVDSRFYGLNIHRHKFSSELIYSLRDSKIFIEDPRDYNWFKFEMKAGLIYMGFLATELAKINGMEPITDKTEFSDLFLLSQFQPSDQKSGLLSFTLENLLPSPTASSDIFKVITFRERNEADLLRFRSAIRKILVELRKVENDNQIQSKISEYEDEIREECLTINTKLKENRIDTILGSLDSLINLSQPEILTTLGLSFKSEALALTAIGINAAIKVGTRIFDGIKRRNNIFESSNYSYVYKINEEFTTS